MVFNCDGKTYDSQQMRVYETRDVARPMVYVTLDLECAFVVTMDRWKGVSVHRADEAEVKSLAAQFNIPDLLRALKPMAG
jgi:hypothetical protein